MKIIAYTYEADTHCVPCAQSRFKARALAALDKLNKDSVDTTMSTE